MGSRIGMVRAEYHVRCPDAPLGNKVLKSVTLFAAFEATVVTDRQLVDRQHVDAAREREDAR